MTYIELVEMKQAMQAVGESEKYDGLGADGTRPTPYLSV
jgi:hypothetical protein